MNATETIPDSTVEAITQAIAVLEKLHPKGCCMPVRSFQKPVHKHA